MKLARPFWIASHGVPTAQAAATEAITFSTWKPICPLRVSGTRASGRRLMKAPSTQTTSPRSTNTTRLPCAMCVAMTGWCPSCAKKVTLPGQCGAMATTAGSAALSTAVPVGATLSTITRLSTFRSSSVVM